MLILLIVKLLLPFGPQTKSYITSINSWNTESIHLFGLFFSTILWEVATLIPYSTICYLSLHSIDKIMIAESYNIRQSSMSSGITILLFWGELIVLTIHILFIYRLQPWYVYCNRINAIYVITVLFLKLGIQQCYNFVQLFGCSSSGKLWKRWCVSTACSPCLFSLCIQIHL